MTMIEVKTSELIGAALDWATAEAAGWQPKRMHGGIYMCVAVLGYDDEPEPSTDWWQIGPLIEKYEIAIEPTDSDPGASWRWVAKFESDGNSHGAKRWGPTPLIAACRAIVAARLGDTVSVPAELVAK